MPEDKIVVTPLAADHSLFFPRSRAFASARIVKKYQIRAPYILYASRIEHPCKNHLRLISAFEILKRATKIPHQLVLAGGDWHRADEVHRRAEQSSFSSEIVFTGLVPNADLPDLYCGAEIFVFPSLYESFALNLLEALSCGVSVACSNTSSMPEVVGKTGILFDPYDESAMAEAMQRILTDVNLREQYEKAGLLRSREFSWAKTARRTLAVIREVTAS